MKVTEFEFTPENHFVAMEYYRLISNRTFLILITEKHLIGIKVHGMIGVETHDPMINLLPLVVNGDLSNPYSYINPKYINKIKDTDLLSEEFLKDQNFRINRTDIIDVEFDKRKKWGMGYYPHDGKVYIKTKDYKRREFIIMGSQSGQKISETLNLSH
jgi:hypothetical protein